MVAGDAGDAVRVGGAWGRIGAFPLLGIVAGICYHCVAHGERIVALVHQNVLLAYRIRRCGHVRVVYHAKLTVGIIVEGIVFWVEIIAVQVMAEEDA